MNDITRPVPKEPKNDQPPGPREAVAPGPVASEPKPEPLDLPQNNEPLKLQAAPKKRIWLRWLVGVVVFLFLTLIAAGVAGYMWYKAALEPVSSKMENKNFKVAEGASVDEIASGLEQEGLVRSALATQIYMRLNQLTSVKAGSYVLSPNLSVAEIAEWLNEGQIDTLRVTILPGRTLSDLKKDLSQYGFSEAELDAALNKNWDHPLFVNKPVGVNNEGYVYPETYFMESTATAEDLLLRSFDEFMKQLQENGYQDKLAARGFDIHEAITLASIVSGEVTAAEDQRIVSQVFQTRLNDGMVLGSDVTYIYAAKQLGVPASPNIDSPYNTRRVPGLPPGAVSNFNLPALDAVANPANTTYLFFVAGDDGVTHYSYTFAEHEANIAKYCHRACMSN